MTPLARSLFFTKKWDSAEGYYTNQHPNETKTHCNRFYSVRPFQRVINHPDWTYHSLVMPLTAKPVFKYIRRWIWLFLMLYLLVRYQEFTFVLKNSRNTQKHAETQILPQIYAETRGHPAENRGHPAENRGHPADIPHRGLLQISATPAPAPRGGFRCYFHVLGCWNFTGAVLLRCERFLGLGSRF